MPAMKVGAMIEPRLPGAIEFAVAAERIGVDSLWIPEVWGYDALTGLAYLAAKTSSVQLERLSCNWVRAAPRCWPHRP